MPSIEEWTCDDVGVWLEQNGFYQYRNLFCNQHKIDGKALLELTEYDLRHPPLQIAVLGDIKRMIICLRKLHVAVNKDSYQIVNDHAVYQRHNVNMCPDRLQCNRMIRSRSLGSWNEHVHIKPILEENVNAGKKEQIFMKSPKLDGEVWKTVIGFLYVFFVGLLTSFTMVIVHDRVPDMKKYPPLPDIFLDNVPYISWAFGMCEFTGILLALIWGTIMLFHRHRFILLRRFFALMGTVFLLRCVTMLITSLSVPGLHLKCSSQTYGDVWSQIQQAFQIWKGMGMSLQGVRTCGDYMYSGHTCMLTLLNFFVTEYTPHQFYYLHILTWVMNLFGIFFILAAHEHYSIDVFIAFYITSRLFLYYHTLSNNRALMQRDGERTRIWFPLFSFFESRVDGIVPNEYEWPFQELITKILLYFKSYLTKKHIE